MTWRVELGDCIERLREMPDASIDAVVTDPPYGIGFMGHDWDQPGDYGAARSNGRANGGQWNRDGRSGPADRGSVVAGTYDLSPTANRRFQAWCEAWASEALRVLKPGGHLLVFGSTRTYHRMAAGVEDAGFEIRDTLTWMFGSGFPKSLNVSRKIDYTLGEEPTEIGRRENRSVLARASDTVALTTGTTPEAQQWEGWGTALKPGYEPVVMARKPLAGTVAANVLAHGPGALNIDECRIGDAGGARRGPDDIGEHGEPNAVYGAGLDLTNAAPRIAGLGRWPANVMLDEDAAAALDEQTGELLSGANPTRRGADKFRDVYGEFAGQAAVDPARGADRGGASRFYYCAKASSAEREAGLDALPTSGERPTMTPTTTLQKGRSGGQRVDDRDPAPGARANVHPTVKPIDVMRWLVRLVTPPGGTVLDVFVGSGTTGCAAVLEGFDFVGIERDEAYAAIAEARIAWWARQPEGVELADLLAAEGRRRTVTGAGQAELDLFGGEAA